MVVPGKPGENLQGDNHVMGDVVRGAAERVYRWINSGKNALRTYVKKPREAIDPAKVYDPNNPAHRSKKGLMWMEDSHFNEFRDYETGDQASDAEFYKKLYENPPVRTDQFYRLAKLPGMRNKIEQSLTRDGGKQKRWLPHNLYSKKRLEEEVYTDGLGKPAIYRLEYEPVIDEVDHIEQFMSQQLQPGLFYAAVDAIKHIQTNLVHQHTGIPQ